MTDYQDVKRPTHFENAILSSFEAGESFEYYPMDHYLTFLLSGSIRVTIGDGEPYVLNTPTMYLAPKEKAYSRITLEPAQMITFPLKRDKLSLSLLSLTKEQCKQEVEKNTIVTLPIDNQFHQLLLFFAESFSFSYLSEAYYELKLTELIYLIKTQFTDEERIGFFSHMVDDDFLFTDFIMNNYEHIDNVKELVGLSCYSLSGFEKKFKRIFKKSPSIWLRERKKRRISGELHYTNKSLKQISSEYGFCSPTHFNNYCKSVFGMSPGEIRKKDLDING